MLEGLGFSVIEYSPEALLGAAILMLFMGWLIPKRILDDKNEEIKYLKSALEVRTAAQAKSDEQTTELLEVTKTTQSLIHAFLKVAEAGDADVAVEKKQGGDN